MNLTTILTLLLQDNKLTLAYELLDYLFSKATALEHFDILGGLAQKAEYRTLHLKCAEAAYSLVSDPGAMRIARKNLIQAYNAANLPEKALFYSSLSLQEDPEDFEFLSHYYFSLVLLGQRAKVETEFQQLFEKFPEQTENLHNALAGLYLKRGDIKKGVSSFLSIRNHVSSTFIDALHMKRWSGVIEPGRTIYVEGEGGIGDEIINIRFFDRIKKLGMKPVLYSAWHRVRPDLTTVFKRCGYEVIAEIASIDPRELWCPMMLLPAILNLQEKDLWTGPYLTSLKQPHNVLPPAPLKIGIKCSGNPYFSQNQYRVIPLDEVVEALPPHADLYYLDKSPLNHPRVRSLSDRINTWDDTLDFIEQMDYVVSSCTSVAHAAGALGKRTYVILPILEYYIWTSSHTDNTTPWYGPHVRFFKQSKVRDWSAPLQQLHQELQ